MKNKKKNTRKYADALRVVRVFDKYDEDGKLINITEELLQDVQREIRRPAPEPTVDRTVMLGILLFVSIMSLCTLMGLIL